MAPLVRGRLFTVTSARDDGPGTLRQALLDANATPGADTIVFDIPLPGPRVIAPASPLPRLTEAVTIDGESQPGAVKAERAAVDERCEWLPRQASPAIVIDGEAAGDTAGLALDAGGCVIRGLLVRRFERAGIEIAGAGGNRIEENAFEENGGPGVVVLSGANNTILGDSIAANGGRGIQLGADSLGSIGQLVESGTAQEEGEKAVARPNNGQSAPVLSSISRKCCTPPADGDGEHRAPMWSVTIAGSIQSHPLTECLIEFLAVDAKFHRTIRTEEPAAVDHDIASSSRREAAPADETFESTLTVHASPAERSHGGVLGSAKVTTDAEGRAAFTIVLPTETPIPSGALVTATATDPAGNTSEMSEPLVASPLSVSWAAPVSGNWNDGSKWSGGAAPGPSDDVVIGVEGTYTVTLNVSAPISSLTLGAASGAQTLSISANTLVLGDASTVGANGVIAQSGGTLSGPGTLTVNGTYAWTGGSLLGPGPMEIAQGATLEIGGADGQNLTRTIDSAGTTRWTGTGPLGFNSPGVFNNQSGGIFSVESAATTSGSGVLNNAGTFVKSSDGTARVGVHLNNSGSVDVHSGVLILSAGGTSTGPYDASGATLTFAGGNTNLSGGASITAATLNISSGTLTAAAAVSVSGTTRVSGGSAAFSGSVASLGSALSIEGGGVTLSSTEGALSVTSFTQSGGFLDGSTALTVTGACAWDGGQMTGVGTTRIAPGATLTLGGSGTPTLARTLSNAGTAQWTGAGAINLTTPGVLRNEPTGVFDVRGATTMGNSGRFDNQGSFLKSAGLTSTISAPFNNTGTVQVQTGTLVLSGGGASTGPFDATGAALVFGAGTHDLSGGAAITAANLTVSGATVTTSAPVMVAGTTSVTAGSLTFSGSPPSLGASVTISGGILSFNTTGDPPSLASVTQTGGRLAGSSSVTVTGSYEWSGGAMSDSGTTTLASGATLEVGGPVSLERTLENSGTITSTGSVVFTVNASGTLTNQAAGTVSLQTGQRIDGTGTVNNAGSLVKTSPGISTIAAVFNNSGTVQVQSGTLVLTKGGTSTGPFNASGAGLTFGGGAHTLSGGATMAVQDLTLSGGTLTTSALVSVSGTTSVTGASATLSGSVPTLGSPVTISGGTLDLENTEGALAIPVLTESGGTLTGASAVTVSGTCTWSGGTISGPGALTLAPGAVLTISGGANLQRILHNHAATSWTGPNPFSIGASGLFVNESDGVFAVQNSSLLTGSGSFENHGSFVKSSTGVTNCGVTFFNAGPISVNAGTLTFGGTFSQSSGSLALNGGAVAATKGMTLDGGTVLGSGTITGTIVNTGGALSPGASPGAIAVTGGYTQGAGGHYSVELGGSPDSGLYDHTSVTAAASLGGALDVSFVDDFVPSIGDNFPILTFGSRTGTFAAENLPAVPPDAQWNVIYRPTSVTLAVERLGAGSDLGIAIADSPDPVNAATTLTYTLTVSNHGPDPADSLTVVDTLPSGTTSASATGPGWTCGGVSGGKITCTRAALDVDASAPITVAMRAPLTGPLSTAATVTSIKRDFVSENNTATETTDVTPVADVAIAIGDSRDPVNQTVPFSYILAVGNAGPSPATDVTVTDNLPANVTDAAATGSGWDCGPAVVGTITCTRPVLPQGSAPLITVTVTSPAFATTLVNAASVSSPVLDLVSSNNTAQEETEVTELPPQADLTISITDIADPVGALGQLRYTLAVANEGPDDAESVTVMNVLPDGATSATASGAGWTCAPPDGAQIVCTRAALAGGAAAPIDVRATAPGDGGIITDSATIASPTADPDGSDNSDSEATTITPRADLAIVQTDSPDPVEPGGSVTYVLTASNAGPSTATNVAVTDTLPAGVTDIGIAGEGWGCNPISHGAITCIRPSLQVGTAPPLTVTLKAPDEIGTLVNLASVSSPVSDPHSTDNSELEETTIQPAGSQADIALDVSDSPDPVKSGAIVMYSLAVSNAGPSAAANLTLSMTLPAGAAGVSTSATGWTCAPPAGGVLTCARGSLAVGSAPIVKVSLTAPASGPLTLSASATAVTDDPDLSNNPVDETTTVTAVADLATTETDAPDPVLANGPLTYTLTVQNGGPSAATDVIVTETLPAGATAAAASGPGWTCAAPADGVIVCTRASLAIGVAPSIAVTLTAPANGPLTNVASVNASTLDLNAANDTATEVTAVTALADLSLEQSDAPDPVQAGAAVTYTLTVANAGPSTALGVIVTDLLPAGVTGAAATGSGWTCAPPASGAIVCTRPSLEVGAAPAIALTAAAPGAAVTLSNTASVAASTLDPNPGNETKTVQTLVQVPVPHADLSIGESDAPDPAPAGTDIAWTVTVSNTGPDAAATITVTDTLPAEVTGASASGDGWTCDPPSGGQIVCVRSGLAAGGAAPLIVHATAPREGGSVANSVSVSAATSDPDPSNNAASESTTIVPRADLMIAASDSPDPVGAGDTLTYTLTVSNGGPSTATNVVVTDSLPEAATDAVAEGDGWTCTPPADGTITCSRASLGAGSAAPITLTVTAPDFETLLVNNASLSSATEDPNQTNNLAVSETSVLKAPPQADLSISQTDSPDPVSAGGTLTYHVTVTNAGPDAAAGAMVSDTLPAGVTGASMQGSGWTCGPPSNGAIACTRPALGVGDAPVLDLTVTAPGKAAMLGNTATVSASTADPDAGNQTTIESTTVEGLPPVADLAIRQTDSPDPVASGGTLTYTVTVTNLGPDLANGITVTDTLPAGATNANASGLGWTCGPPSAVTTALSPTITCTRAGVDVGDAPPITVTVTAPATGPLTNAVVVHASSQDPFASNNTATEGTVVATGSSGADLGIAIGGVGESVEAGQSLTYALEVTNSGPDSARTVVVSGTIPEGLKAGKVAGRGWRCAKSRSAVTCKRGALAVGDAPPITIATRAPGRAGAIAMTATVSSSTSDPAATNNADDRTTPVTRVDDLAVRALAAPRAVGLAGPDAGSTVRVRVQIENRSPHEETFSDLEQLRALVTLTVHSLGGCPDLQPALIAGAPQTSLPRTLRPLERLNVWFEVPVSGACMNDPARSTQNDPGHGDFRVDAMVNHAALDGDADTHTVDDACPRIVSPPFVVDPYPYGNTKDKGCGARRSDGTFGDPVLIDLFLR